MLLKRCFEKFAMNEDNRQNRLNMRRATHKTQKTFVVSLAHYASFAQQIVTAYA